MPKRVEHTGRPDCMTCITAVGTAGAQAFRRARAQSRRVHTRPHEPGSTPVADEACRASYLAESQVDTCYSSTEL